MKSVEIKANQLLGLEILSEVYMLAILNGGKAQLAKEITSFANCEGGWLIVGIDDKTKKIQPIDKQDYSQRIGKIATRISPVPEFSTRFLASPDNKRTGVLVVYVYEGKNAPLYLQR